MCIYGASLVAQEVKSLPATQETWIQPLGWEEPLEEGMATHSSVLAWRIPWTEEPGGLQSMESQSIGHNSVTKRTRAHARTHTRQELGREGDLFKELAHVTVWAAKSEIYMAGRQAGGNSSRSWCQAEGSLQTKFPLP